MMMKEYKLYKDLIITGPLSTIILQFLSDMRFSGRKYRSEECYLKSIDETAKEMNCSENDLSQELVEKWIQKNDFESHKTWSNRIVIIRRLAKYMNARGYNAYTTPIIVSKKSTDFVPYIFTKKELQRLFDAADHLPSYANCPNRTIVFSLLIRLLYGCGLRISEALHLKMKDVDLKNGVLCIRQSKFEKSRYVPMDLNLTERCKKYVQLIRNNATAEDFFLPSPDNGPYSHLLEAGVNLVYIRDILGHVDIATTEVYARANLAMKQAALEKVSNISNVNIPSWLNNDSLLEWLNNFNKSLR